MLDGHDTASLGINVAAAKLICTETVTALPVSVSTLNEVECCPAGNPDVRKVKVSVPLFTPLFGDTVSHVAVGGTMDHLRARLPPLFMRTVLEATLLPAVP